MSNILITGGSSGIGHAFLKNYLSAGHSVYNFCRSGPFDGGIDNYYWTECDMSDPLGFMQLIKTMDHPIYDVLINNAGVMKLTEGHVIYEEMIEEFNVNLFSHFLLTQYIAEYKMGSGSILNIASVAGMAECDFAMVYGMTKAAQISMTKTLAHHFAPRIRVNALCPGFTKSNLVDGETPPELIAELVPLKFEAEPETIVKIGKAVIENEFMTGSIVVVDGGELNG